MNLERLPAHGKRFAIQREAQRGSTRQARRGGLQSRVMVRTEIVEQNRNLHCGSNGTGSGESIRWFVVGSFDLRLKVSALVKHSGDLID